MNLLRKIFKPKEYTKEAIYDWLLKDSVFNKDKGKVFSCFACGGGSSMGYKLAGFDVIGINEIDNRITDTYVENFNPKYVFREPIQELKLRKDLPEELYGIDILDGSPPCSTFSLSGLREKAWGVKKKFREGQIEQVLDTLFFDFIDLANELQPKIVIAENVKGLLCGRAKEYVVKIHEELDKIGYNTIHVLLNASHMGVPQKRERVFFIGVRKDLNIIPKQEDFIFNEPVIPFSEIDDGIIDTYENVMPCDLPYIDICEPGKAISSVHPKGNRFNAIKANPNDALRTIASGSVVYHHQQHRRLTKNELCKACSFPLDYNFGKNKPQYLMGMSVPPIMIYKVVNRVYDNILSKIK